jgi:hypothetical protein
MGDRESVNLKEAHQEITPATALRRNENYVFALRRCAVAGENFCELCSFKNRFTVKSRVIAIVMGQKTPDN